MGLQITHLVTDRLRVYVEQEAIPAAGVLPSYVRATATGAIRVKSCDIEPTFDRMPRRDAHGGRQDISMLSGKRYAKWRITKYAMGSGVAATPADDDVIHESFWGGRTVAANVTYAPTSTQQLRTFSLSRIGNYDDAILMTTLIGCLCDEWKVIVNGTDFAMFEFAGPAYDFRETGYGVNTTVGAGTAKTLGAGEGDGYEGGNPFGSIISIGGRNNTGIGYRVNSIATDTLTLEASDTSANGDVVRPFAPAPTTAGVPISHNSGSLTIQRSGLSAQTLAIKTAEISAKNNAAQFLDHFGEATPIDMKLGIREIEVKLVVRARRDFVVWMGRRKSFTATAIVLTIGSAAGARWLITVPQAELKVGKVSYPDAGNQDEAEIELAGMALDTATGQDGNDDAISIVSN